MDEYRIRVFEPGNEHAVHRLVRDVFDAFVAPGYTVRGNEFFYEFIAADRILERFRSGNIILTAKSGDDIIGLIEVRDCNHICLLFVDTKWHGKGVARKLLKEAIARCKSKNINIEFIEVNASPFSEIIYRKLDFVKTQEQQEINGMRFVPMKLVL